MDRSIIMKKEKSIIEIMGKEPNSILAELTFKESITVPKIKTSLPDIKWRKL
jgi:hypothetical protein